MGRFIGIEGNKVHYLSTSTGKPVVLLHGAAMLLQDWLPMLADLNDRYRAVAFDRRLSLGQTSRLRKAIGECLRALRGRTSPAIAMPATATAASHAGTAGRSIQASGAIRLTMP